MTFDVGDKNHVIKIGNTVDAKSEERYAIIDDSKAVIVLPAALSKHLTAAPLYFADRNVASFGGRFAGVGGFANISQSAKRVVFCCTFTANGLEVEIRDNALHVVREGSHPQVVRLRHAAVTRSLGPATPHPGPRR